MPSHCVTTYAEPNLVTQVSLDDSGAGACWEEVSSGWDPHFPHLETAPEPCHTVHYATGSQKSSKKTKLPAEEGLHSAVRFSRFTSQLCITMAAPVLLASPPQPSKTWAKLPYPTGLRGG